MTCAGLIGPALSARPGRPCHCSSACLAAFNTNFAPDLFYFHATQKVQPRPYDIPCRSLVPKKVGNLLVAGRCHGATPLANSSTRVTATAMAMGQAAGLAAAFAVRNCSDLGEHDGAKVREQLDAKGWGPVRIDHR